ncbi:MAG: exodeoxyribonuclease VII large subunit [Salinisphaera sp.]|nr:exodeoxyribonuclease VII large subunit [Salinisphaera sp.]
MSIPSTKRRIYRVSELVNTARDLLEQSFPMLWIEGEVSNLARPASGHWYFTLKDAHAQVRCAMFANRNRLVAKPPNDGDQLLVRAKVSLYPARGAFQLIVESCEDAGLGALQRAFEQTRDRLAAEGLFDEAGKRPLPVLPRSIGVVTSGTGAALRDVLAVLRRRYPMGRVVLHPAPVQGQTAPAALVRALALAGQRRDCDVLLLVRGGGSLEDLQAFNDEAVARAIRACPLPVISGVGPEVDVTIADIAADRRAPTPSAAAELVCPDLAEVERRARELAARAHCGMRRQLARTMTTLTAIEQRIARAHPGRQLQQRMQRLDELDERLRRAIAGHHRQAQARIEVARATLAGRSPTALLEHNKTNLKGLRTRLAAAARIALQGRQQRWRLAMRALDGVSPLNTLARGYAMVHDSADNLVTDAERVSRGASVRVRLRRGRLECRVEVSRRG